ncbi:MAG: hypothetical protein IJ683_04780 [Butyrivibrio sp.]|nr:hypothetical protein [Butyrivibrio sp.]MBR1641622.1 hypothetical protein [Butyrivibrio sp.]
MSNSILKYVVVDAIKTAGIKMMMLECRPHYPFVEGIRGEQDGIVVTGLSEKMGYEKADIKILGLSKLPFDFDGTPTPVEFEDLEGKLWQDWNNKGAVKLSLSAKGVKLAGNKRIKLGGDNE